jgi:hypothetical protein
MTTENITVAEEEIYAVLCNLQTDKSAGPSSIGYAHLREHRNDKNLLVFIKRLCEAIFNDLETTTSC